MVKKPLVIDRRTMMVSALAIAASSAPARSMAVGTRPNAQRLWYRQPAGAGSEALPIGNGRLGTMVFGRVGQERLQLNEATLWAGGPYTPDNPDALAALPEVRALIAAGCYKEAEKLISDRVMAKPLWQM